MTKLSSIPDHQLSITCGLCKHHSMLEVANLIAVVGEDATAHDVRQRYSCPKCKTKGNNTYQIIYRGNSDIALDGAAVGLRQLRKFDLFNYFASRQIASLD